MAEGMEHIGSTSFLLAVKVSAIYLATLVQAIWHEISGFIARYIQNPEGRL